MEIIVRKTVLYGNPVVYPRCEKALAFAAIAGAKTLTPQVIDQIKRLGYVVRVEQAEVVL